MYVCETYRRWQTTSWWLSLNALSPPHSLLNNSRQFSWGTASSLPAEKRDNQEGEERWKEIIFFSSSLLPVFSLYEDSSPLTSLALFRMWAKISSVLRLVSSDDEDEDEQENADGERTTCSLTRDLNSVGRVQLTPPCRRKSKED